MNIPTDIYQSLTASERICAAISAIARNDDEPVLADDCYRIPNGDPYTGVYHRNETSRNGKSGSTGRRRNPCGVIGNCIEFNDQRAGPRRARRRTNTPASSPLRHRLGPSFRGRGGPRDRRDLFGRDAKKPRRLIFTCETGWSRLV